MMMILADSCCDLSPELLKKTQARVAPLTITIDDTHYVDDGTVDIPPYLAAMKASKNPVRSACPSPDLYAEDIKAADGDCFIITLSSKLSGSHNAAVLGVQLAEEDMPEKKVHVFDSESASAGETYLALMIHDLIAAGKSFEQIVETVEEKIRSMHTLFVLDSLDNLVKNGRISKTVALLANVLSIRLLMSDDGHGAIKNISKARGIKGALTQMVETCRKHTEGLAAASQRLVISYCNCPERARQVRDMIREKCPAIGEIVMTPTSALSSMYANDGGVVIAY
ncbi:MAG: DegV family protein, partial [Christensenellales bacterium]